jgi:hypothetical protein
MREKKTNTRIIHSVIQWRATHAHRITRHNTQTYNILSTASQLSIPPNALGTPSDDGNIMPKCLGTTIYCIINKLHE